MPGPYPNPDIEAAIKEYRTKRKVRVKARARTRVVVVTGVTYFLKPNHSALAQNECTQIISLVSYYLS